MCKRKTMREVLAEKMDKMYKKNRSVRPTFLGFPLFSCFKHKFVIERVSK